MLMVTKRENKSLRSKRCLNTISDVQHAGLRVRENIVSFVKREGMLMSYKGAMDGWHGDEYECHGKCHIGYCSMCDERRDGYADQEYDTWKDLQANGG